MYDSDIPVTHYLLRQRCRERCCLIMLFVVMTGMSVLSLCVGDQWFSPQHWWQDEARLFIWQIRLPRTLAVLLTGAALAACGTVMQALFENPLAEPGVLGVSNGAGVALVVAVMCSQGTLPDWTSGICAIAGALFITSILLIFTRRYLSTSRLLLTGVALGIICSALMTWAVYLSSNLDLRQLMYWMMGGFGGVSWQQGWLMAALFPVIIWVCTVATPLNFMALGDVSARQLGLRVLLWRNILVLATGWLVGVSVALAGAIGFIGLVVPHMLRLNGFTDHRILLPASALSGGAVLLAADIVARQALSTAELPVGVVTATLGAPVFIWLLLKAHR